ncbi:MAG: GTP 3',8-cyclase MoaA [Polyangiaceae bacterium]|nr:GTP 3',8-cyclase MoaA [Polyangiaceae bacterium]
MEDTSDAAPPLDRFRRSLSDLRISVTDRCNFRCTYCMPRDKFGPDFPFLSRSDLLSYEEITRVAGVFVDLGVRKLRITGGEPLLRRDLPKLIEQLRLLDQRQPHPQPLDLALTTNGVLLPRLAHELKAAGLDRVTVSLDSLDQAEFARMSDSRYRVEEVLDGIRAAEQAGLGPIKVNAVVRKGHNEAAIVDLARHFRGSGAIVRYIEFMDVGTSNDWQLTDVVSAKEIVERIDAQFPLEAAEANYPGEVASRYRYRDGQGEVGVIASVTQPFCGACSRARLSSEGKLYTCLFSGVSRDLKALLRSGASDAQLAAQVRGIWRNRADRYSELRGDATARLPKVEMSHIGG